MTDKQVLSNIMLLLIDEEKDQIAFTHIDSVKTRVYQSLHVYRKLLTALWEANLLTDDMHDKIKQKIERLRYKIKEGL